MNHAFKSVTRPQGRGMLSGAIATVALAILVVPAWAIFPQLSTTLTGAAMWDGLDVGTITLVHGQGQVSTTVQNQVGRNSGIGIMQGTTVILSNPAAWKN